MTTWKAYVKPQSGAKGLHFTARMPVDVMNEASGPEVGRYKRGGKLDVYSLSFYLPSHHGVRLPTFLLIRKSLNFRRVIISCIQGIFECIASAVMAVISAIAGCLECIISGKSPVFF